MQKERLLPRNQSVFPTPYQCRAWKDRALESVDAHRGQAVQCRVSGAARNTCTTEGGDEERGGKRGFRRSQHHHIPPGEPYPAILVHTCSATLPPLSARATEFGG